MPRILCLWFPHWPLQRVIVARPELKGEPLILFTVDARQIPRVVDGSLVVRQQGVRKQMPLREATALLQHAPARAKQRDEPICLSHQPSADQKALEQLAEYSERFSPLVGWQTSSASKQSPWFAPGDCLFADISGVHELFGGEENLLIQVREAFRQRGYYPRLAIADTLGAAWGVVHFGERLEESFRLGSNCWIVPPEKALVALRNCPLEALRLPIPTLKLFRQLGIEKLEQFARIPRAELAHRLGQEPLERWDELQGTAMEQIVAHRPAPEFVTQVCLEYPLTGRSHLEEEVARLMRTLAQQLAPHRRGALRLECRLDGVSGDPLRLNLDLFRPTARAEHWFELVRLQLEQIRPPDAIQQIRLEIRQTAPLAVVQPSLFAEKEGKNSQQARKQFWNLVDRLSNRLGPSAVVRTRLERDPQPEQAFSEHPWLESTTGKKHSRTSSLVLPGPFHRPLGFYHPPRPIQVIALAPSGPPLRFAGEGIEFLVTACIGPERIETGWWRGFRVRRDYFRVETTENRRFWLFRCLEEGNWFLQGEF
jgi:protein ImuB